MTSAALIERARRACLTGQPGLAMTYLRAADAASDRERVERQWAMDIILSRRFIDYLHKHIDPGLALLRDMFQESVDAWERDPRGEAS